AVHSDGDVDDDMKDHDRDEMQSAIYDIMSKSDEKSDKLSGLVIKNKRRKNKMKPHCLIIKVWDIENQVYAEMNVLNNLTPEQIKERLAGSRFQFELIRTL